MRVDRVRDSQHFRHAVDLRSFRGDCIGCIGEHEHVDARGPEILRAGDAARGAGIQLAVQMLGDYQYLAHASSPFVFSAATSSAASLTITPLLRLAGAA